MHRISSNELRGTPSNVDMRSQFLRQKSRDTQRMTNKLRSIAGGKDDLLRVRAEGRQSMTAIEMKTKYEMLRETAVTRALSETRDSPGDGIEGRHEVALPQEEFRGHPEDYNETEERHGGH